MSLRHKIGQMLVMGFDGCTVEKDSPVAAWLSNDGLGGVLLFDRNLSTGLYGKNLKTPEQIQLLNQQLQHYSSLSCTTESPPLFIAVDYEGGAVDRLAHVQEHSPTLSALELASLTPDEFDSQVRKMAFNLKSLGFNVNFAPVVDLNIDKPHSIIAGLKRSFSSDPDKVSQLAARFTSLFNSNNIACAYKHFPGHGSAAGDTHQGFVDVTQHYLEDELVPYRHLLNNHSFNMVMTAHIVNRNLDKQGLPATLSYEILTGLLRQTLGFDGIIISDDLQMKAISAHYSLDQALMYTINAGTDMVIFANQLDTISAPEVIDCIEQLVISKAINEQRIEEAYARILRFKRALFLQQKEALN